METAELKRRVDALAGEPDRLRRRLVALGALTEGLAPEGIEPILVGGCALEVYTDGGYATADVDHALDRTPAVDAAFADLGFERRGRFWIRPELDLYVEAPAPAGPPGETAPRMELAVDGLRVVVLGVEDLLLDRLRAAVHRQSTEDGRWAERLVALHGDRMDWDYLRAKTAGDRGEAGTLERLRSSRP